ncbi:hypothetical protein KAH37_02720 [bacterium]|nr:hypothetical protein [bacterium]
MKLEKSKFFFIALLLLVGYALVVVSLYRIQVTEHHDYVEKSLKSTKIVRTVVGKRGSLFDKAGTPLAISKPKLDLRLDPRSIRYKRDMAGVLATITGMPAQEIHTLLLKKTHYLILKRDVPYEWKEAYKKAYKKAVNAKIRAKRERISKKKLNRLLGIVNDFNMVLFESGYKRVYPQKNLFSNVLGFVRRSDMKGVDGLEYKHDKYLHGKKINIERFRNAVGKQGVREVAKELKNNSGNDIYLTIDARIQYIAEDELAKMVKKSGAKWGSVTIMNPLDGKIIALANYPSYNPAKFWDADPASRRNYAVLDLFEPGSTMKIFSLLAVLNANLVKPGELIFGENGVFRFGHRLIHDHKAGDWMTLKDIVVTSSNIGTVKLADRLKKEELYNALRSFGFGEKSGIDVAGEAATPIRSWKKWYPIDKANIAFGQGLMVNTVQMVRAFASLYSGVLWTPRIIDRIVEHTVDPRTGEEIEKEIFLPIPPPKSVKFSYNSNKKMIAMLESVVSEGTAKRAQIKGVEVGGKTGTSQKYDHEIRRYSRKKVVASFIGAVPNETPKMIMMVVIEEPKGREYGGTVAAPVFQAVAKRALPLMGIYLPPEKDSQKKRKQTSITSNDVTTPLLPENSGKKDTLPEGYVVVPNVVGLNLQQATFVAHNAGLDIQFSGESNDLILEQSPDAGDVQLFGTVISLSLKGATKDVYEEAEIEED